MTAEFSAAIYWLAALVTGAAAWHWHVNLWTVVLGLALMALADTIRACRA